MIGAIMGIGGALMGALNANSASNQSWQRQHQLMEIQAELNRKNAKFNTAQAKEMWNKTNYEAQLKHMEAAGLNPGLMYGMGGSGGATTNTAPGNVSSGHATPSPNIQGMGLQTIAQIKLLEAQKENIEADTANEK